MGINVKLRFIITVMTLSSLLGMHAAFAMQSYGPTKTNETLWSIAKNHRPAKVTVDQAALAIAKLNPKAFQGADFVLRPHSYLRLPTTSTEVKSALGLNAVSVNHAKAKTQSQPKLAAEKPKYQPKPYLSKKTYSSPVLSQSTEAANQAAAAQIAQLTQQLNAANQKVDLLEQQLDGNSSGFPWSSLWFILWALSSISLYMVYRHYKRGGAVEDQDPSLNEQLKEARGKTEPIIISVSEKEPENPFEQGELDIPADETTAVQKSEQEELEDEVEEPEEVPATPEIEALLQQIETDPYNLELRMQVLELYASVSDLAGFNQQSQDMLSHNLMMEGDEVWTKVRALYLNTWIYA
ncbi:MAG: putative Tfp pilus assembly protein FimV domain containing protein [Gammaproteobacteria bacterium]|jgi:FimV-like protein|nr:putative Tfp pilus assembly protein FimV domain containing protein [Gammaproteobacteria bacterium]